MNGFHPTRRGRPGARLLPLLAACLLLRPGPLPAAEPRAFFGDDLATVGEPYTLRLPPDAECEVAWGDGAVEAVAAGRPARHTFAKPGVAAVSVKWRQGGAWAALPVDAAAHVRAARPALFVHGEVTPATVFPKVLAGPTDSFAVECRVKFDDPAADQVILVAGPGAGACRFGLTGGSLYFELAGAGTCAVPCGGRVTAGAWHHLAVTYDRAPLFRRSSQVRFFLDGRPIGVGAIPADDAGAVRCPTAEAGGQGFKGRIEALAVYDRLLFPLAAWEHAKALAGATVLSVTVAYRGSDAVAVDLPRITRTVDVPLDPDPKADNGPALRKAIAAAGPNTRLRLAAAAAAGRGGTFFVRSLVEANKWAALVVEGKTDFELDGNGVTLVFADRSARYLCIDRCRRVAVRNLGFDLDPAYARVGVYAKLLAVDPQARTVTARLVHGRDGSPDPVVPRRATYWRWRPHDPRTLRVGRAGPHFDSGSYAKPPAADPAHGPGAVRFTLKQDASHKLWKELRDYAAGDNFFLINNADFGSNAVSLQGCGHVTFDRVRYHATLGMVFLSADVDHLHVARCTVGLPPGLTAADRPLAAGADGYHFHQTRGHILFEGNEVSLTDDDPVSLKDDVFPDVTKVGRDRLAGGRGIAKGSPVELLNPDYGPTGYTATVAAADGGVLTLDRPLPAEVGKGSVLMDRSRHTANWILRDNHLHDYYGRVMLYTDHGTVTGNRVHGSYYHLGNSTADFETAGACRNVVTHRNLFEATVADSSHWGGERLRVSFHQVTFSANSFLGRGLRLNNAADGLVARNWFDGPDAGLSVNRCADTQVLGNRGFQPGAAGFRVTGTNNTNLTVAGNTSEAE